MGHVQETCLEIIVLLRPIIIMILLPKTTRLIMLNWQTVKHEINKYK